MNRIRVGCSNQLCSVCCSYCYVNKGVVNQRNVRIISKVINPDTGKPLDLCSSLCVTLEKDGKFEEVYILTPFGQNIHLHLYSMDMNNIPMAQLYSVIGLKSSIKLHAACIEPH